MAYTYDGLKGMTLAQLRDVARSVDSPALQGFTQMNKEHLLPAICKALGIEAFEHHAAASAEKAKLKARMRELKAARDKSMGSAADPAKLRAIRREYHALHANQWKRLPVVPPVPHAYGLAAN